jgi:Fe-S-cluster containining protein
MNRKFSELTCGTCFRCCTTNEDKRFRTPVLKNDAEKLLDDPEWINNLSSYRLELIANEQNNPEIVSMNELVIPDYISAHTESKAHGCNECKWLGKDGLCSQYEKRPYICKQYPFHFVKVNGQLMFGVVTNNCGLGQDILDGITRKDPEFLNYAYKNYREGMDLMTTQEIESMANYAENNYPAMTIININLIQDE